MEDKLLQVIANTEVLLSLEHDTQVMKKEIERGLTTEGFPEWVSLEENGESIPTNYYVPGTAEYFYIHFLI